MGRAFPGLVSWGRGPLAVLAAARSAERAVGGLVSGSGGSLGVLENARSVERASSGSASAMRRPRTVLANARSAGRADPSSVSGLERQMTWPRQLAPDHLKHAVPKQVHGQHLPTPAPSVTLENMTTGKADPATVA